MALASSLIQRAMDVSQDAGGVRWPVAEWVRWLNDGLRELAIYRPDAYAVTESLSLVAGPRQKLSDTAIKLIDIPNNTGGGMAPVRQIQRSELDEVLPGWRALPGVTVIKHFMHDQRAPLLFDVYPPAAASGAAVDICFAKYPTPIEEPGDDATLDDVTEEVPVPDIFANVLLDYMLYRGFQKDDELPDADGRSTKHYQAFAAAVGIDVGSSVTVAPGIANPGGVNTAGR